MAENYELAYEDYRNGMKYKEIAEKYGVTLNTVKSWKTRKWNELEKGVHTNAKKQKSVHTKKESTKQIARVTEAVESEEFIELENDDFTDKQRLFIVYYVECWNATKAYQKAYGCAYSTARVEGSRCLANPNIREEIIKVRDSLTDDALLNKRVLIQKWIDIAFADIKDYMKFGRQEEVIYNDDGQPELDMNGNVKTYAFNYVHLNESAEIDGTLVTEVKQGKDGVSVKLADKMRAMEFLSKHWDLLNENERKQLQNEQARLNIDRTKAEIKQISNEHAASSKTIIVKNEDEMRRVMNERANGEST